MIENAIVKKKEKKGRKKSKSKGKKKKEPIREEDEEINGYIPKRRINNPMNL